MREPKAKAKSIPEVDDMEQTGRRVGWLAVIAVLSIIGIAAWFFFNGNEQTD
jgi:hypothetical protein